jgi:hypothetical protein
MRGPWRPAGHQDTVGRSDGGGHLDHHLCERLGAPGRIDAFRVRAINLNYLDPGEVDPDAWAADPDTLVLPRAGEDLYRLR